MVALSAERSGDLELTLGPETDRPSNEVFAFKMQEPCCDRIPQAVTKSDAAKLIGELAGGGNPAKCCCPTKCEQVVEKDLKAKVGEVPVGPTIKPTRKRFLILFMFVILQMIKSFQWICLASITNVVARFYNVSSLDVNCTTILFMVTYLVLSLPVSWIIELIGLRKSVLIGTIGVTLGICIKCFSCHPTGFWLSMFGHLIIGLSEPFFFSSYSQVASLWFPDHQVALATSAGIIGEETGLALGFIIPPLVVGNDSDNSQAIQEGLFQLFVTVAIISMANTILIVVAFDEEPKVAPGFARFKQQQAQKEERRRQSQLTMRIDEQQTGSSLTASSASSDTVRLRGKVVENVREQLRLSGEMISNKHFQLLLVGFGLNVGIAYSIHTLLNQMIIQDYDPSNGQQQHSSLWGNEEANLVVGNAGLILIVSGFFGSATCGHLLDRFHRYKLTTSLVYLFTLLSMAVLTWSVALENVLLLYLIIMPLGFALTGYASCALDYGVEITYPRPELISSTLLNLSAQIFGIPISLLGSLIVSAYGSQFLGLFFCLLLLVGQLLACLQGGQLRRQEAVKEAIGELGAARVA